MSIAEKNIIETYTKMISGLSRQGKLALIENLKKSVEFESKNRDSEFYSSFGAFSSEKTAEEIIEEIKSSRKFRSKEIEF